MPNVFGFRGRWAYYETSAGSSPAKEALREAGMSRPEAARLRTLQDRVAEGRATAKDAKKLKGYDNLWEIRLDGDNRIFRLIFSPVHKGDEECLVLLALHYFSKKAQHARQELDRADSRYADWCKRHRPGRP
jgi:phage-related protein